MNITNLPQTTTFGGIGIQCVSGTVTLFRFIQPPPPGSIIGQIQPLFGSPISLIQTQPIVGTQLSAVDGQFAQVCGRFVSRFGQTVLDVTFVNPVVAPLPFPVDQRLLLLLLLLLLLRGFPIPLGLGTTAQTGLGGLAGLLGTPGLGGLQGLLGTPGLGGLAGLLGTPGLGGLQSLLATPGLGGLQTTTGSTTTPGIGG